MFPFIPLFLSRLNAMLGFRHKNHLVNVRKTSRFVWEHLFWSPSHEKTSFFRRFSLLCVCTCVWCFKSDFSLWKNETKQVKSSLSSCASRLSEVSCSVFMFCMLITRRDNYLMLSSPPIKEQNKTNTERAELRAGNTYVTCQRINLTPLSKSFLRTRVAAAAAAANTKIHLVPPSRRSRVVCSSKTFLLQNLCSDSRVRAAHPAADWQIIATETWFAPTAIRLHLNRAETDAANQPQPAALHTDWDCSIMFTQFLTLSVYFICPLNSLQLQLSRSHQSIHPSIHLTNYFLMIESKEADDLNEWRSALAQLKQSCESMTPGL